MSYKVSRKIINSFFFNTKNKEEEGFTSIELIIIAFVVGTISSLVLPQIEPIINKHRQKEAAGIIDSMIKSAQSNYALFAKLPDNMKDISKFASLQKCNEKNANTKGASVCRDSTPVAVGNDLLFYSPSGRYKIEMRKIDTEEGKQIYQVKANPNGEGYEKNGSAVVGCYNPFDGITQIQEYSSKSDDKGVKPYSKCYEDKFCEENPNDPICIDPPDDIKNTNPEASTSDTAKDKNESLEDTSDKDSAGNSSQPKLNTRTPASEQSSILDKKAVSPSSQNESTDLRTRVDQEADSEIESEIEGSLIPPWMK